MLPHLDHGRTCGDAMFRRRVCYASRSTAKTILRRGGTYGDRTERPINCPKGRQLPAAREARTRWCWNAIRPRAPAAAWRPCVRRARLRPPSRTWRRLTRHKGVITMTSQSADVRRTGVAIFAERDDVMARSCGLLSLDDRRAGRRHVQQLRRLVHRNSLWNLA